MLLVGKPGSGKSHLLSEFINNPSMYHKKFNRVLFLSPSRIKSVRGMENDNWNQNLDVEWIKSKIKEAKEDWKESESRKNILIIIDDLITPIKKNQYNPDFMSLFLNRRHLIKNCTVSFIIVTQKYMMVPPVLRSNIDCIVFFRQNRNDLNKIIEECCDDLSNAQLRYLKDHLNTNHNFIYSRIDIGKVYPNFKSFNR
jgi:KaiC/GvpD/RAD55 family RecA-like ATPase